MESVGANFTEESIRLSKSGNASPSTEFSRAVGSAASRLAKTRGKKYLELDGKKFCVNRLLKG